MEYFFEIEITQSEDEIFIIQKYYTTNLMEKFKMEGCKTLETPLDNNNHLE